MKKSIAFLLAIVMMLALGACTQAQTQPTNPNFNEPVTIPSTAPTEPEHTHSYTQTVTAPDCTIGGYTTNTCECGDTYQSDEVEALGHTWVDATCQAPKTCSICAFTEGEVAAHDFQNGTCNLCGEKDPDFKALTKGSWVRGKVVNGQYVEQTLCFTTKDGMGPSWSVRYFEDIGPEADPDFMDCLIAEGKLIKIKNTYYQHFGMGDMGEISFTEKNGKVTVTMLYWDSSITLERVGGNQLKVTAVKGNATVGIGPLKVGDVFTWSK